MAGAPAGDVWIARPSEAMDVRSSHWHEHSNTFEGVSHADVVLQRHSNINEPNRALPELCTSIRRPCGMGFASTWVTSNKPTMERGRVVDGGCTDGGAPRDVGLGVRKQQPTSTAPVQLLGSVLGQGPDPKPNTATGISRDMSFYPTNEEIQEAQKFIPHSLEQQETPDLVFWPTWESNRDRPKKAFIGVAQAKPDFESYEYDIGVVWLHRGGSVTYHNGVEEAEYPTVKDFLAGNLYEGE
eukprot:TRINITY_DN47241_c0_g1_i2.p1 TRINITY_DN47241_c0_g1~~TRINITY_DN47241_c0_g1_i2.p1  ORF type:complete len:252 (-),score=24.59 TRINITY_DN47241_c0_g1_i2:420-1142(-)